MDQDKLSMEFDGDAVIISTPMGVLDGFISKDNSDLMWTDAIEDNNYYNLLVKVLNHYDIPYKIRKARLDNSVRFMVDISNIPTTVDETMTSGAAGGYLTKFRVKKPKSLKEGIDIQNRKANAQDLKSPTGFESSPKPNMYVKTMKFKILKPSERLNQVNSNNTSELSEARYSQFKKQTIKRTPREQLHMAVKEIQMKMDEVNRLVEFTSKMKQELKENEEELKRTKNSLFKIQEKIQYISNKIKTITE